nr:hypothetical protein [uncultured Sphingomonas sp.]
MSGALTILFALGHAAVLFAVFFLSSRSGTFDRVKAAANYSF